MSNEIEIYGNLLHEVKNRVRKAQIKATLSVNAEMLEMYFDIGKMIYLQQQKYGWGAKITKRLAIDIKNELPEEKGFSERNLNLWCSFIPNIEKKQ